MRSSVSAARPLSLSEELERLEQSITLTLQEIDQNFSRAHTIVTSSILPVIEQYAAHSSNVWEGSKFWKQFFEASANVSLSGVEEQEEQEDQSYTQSYEDASAYTGADETARTHDRQYDDTEESLLGDDVDISGSTPRARPTTSSSDKSKFAGYSSQYEALKQELKGGKAPEDDSQLMPSTPGPGRQSLIPDMSMTPQSSPFDHTAYLRSVAQKKQDPLLHRVLDKAYRVQATPHTARKENKTPLNKPSWRGSDSPMSSPPVAAPQLRSEIFGSPIRQQYRANAPRTPGVSVQTPAKSKAKEVLGKSAKKDEISWESDSDDDDMYKQLGMSPPKTIQFNLPQSRLLQTPAREASKRIVEDILTTAGARFDDTDELDSPSMVKMRDELDDSF